MKIAVAVYDEKLEVFTRVGRAPWFAIFEDDRFLELRPNRHAASHDHEGGHHGGGHGHGMHDGHGRGMGHGRGEGHGHGFHAMEEYSPEEVELHRKDLGNLSDIDIMLVRAVGPNMKEALELSGIDVVKVRKKDGEKADVLVKNYLENRTDG